MMCGMRAALLGLLISGPCVTPSTNMQQHAYQPLPEDTPSPVAGESTLAGEDPPDITRFLKVRRAGAPSLSPEGTRVAYSTGVTGVPQVWVVGAEGGVPRQLTFGEPITFHAWSPAGDWIAYGADRGGNEREGFTLITTDGTRERELLAPSDAFRSFGGFSPDGGRIAYTTTERNGVDFDVHVLDLETGADARVLAGRMGLHVAAWRPDGGALLLSETRGEDANDVHLLDLETGALETLFEPEVPAAYSSFAWRPDGSGFYMACDQDREFAGLAYFDVAAGELEWRAAPERDVEGVSLSSDGAWLVHSENDGGSSLLSVVNTRDGSVLDAPASLPRGILRARFGHGSNVLTVTASGPGIPGDIWTWNVESGAVHRATQSASAGLDMAAMVSPEHVDFPARDDVMLHGLLYMPRPGSWEGGPPPVVLAVHGGPTGQVRPRFRAEHQYLMARGIAVFDLNFRGSTGYGKTFARLDNGRLRPNAVLDMADAVAWLRQDGRVDASRAAVMGGSYGGYLTFAALTDLPGLFKGGVSFVGVSDWVRALEEASPDLKASDRLEYGDIDDPEDRAFFKELSPITRVHQVTEPIMVLHGANDPRDPVTESDRFVAAVRAQGGEAEYMRFPDEGHGIRKLANRITAYRRVAAFLERILAN